MPEYLRTSGVAAMDLDVIRSRGPRQWRSSGRAHYNVQPDNFRGAKGENKECYNCGGIGHISRFSPSPRHRNPSRSFNQGRQSGR